MLKDLLCLCFPIPAKRNTEKVHYGFGETRVAWVALLILTAFSG